MFYVRARITDYKGKPIANANVTITDAAGEYLPVNGENIGRISDSKGAFVIPVTNEDAFITISSVGYTRLTLPATAAKNKTTLKLQTNEQAIEETTISAPAPRPRAAGRPEMAMASVPAPNKKTWYIIGGAAGLALIGVAVYYFTKRK